MAIKRFFEELDKIEKEASKEFRKNYQNFSLYRRTKDVGYLVDESFKATGPYLIEILNTDSSLSESIAWDMYSRQTDIVFFNSTSPYPVDFFRDVESMALASKRLDTDVWRTVAFFETEQYVISVYDCSIIKRSFYGIYKK